MESSGEWDGLTAFISSEQWSKRPNPHRSMPMCDCAKGRLHKSLAVPVVPLIQRSNTGGILSLLVVGTAAVEEKRAIQEN